MRFYLILFFCVSVFFIGCKEDKTAIPDDVIQLHEMAALLTDIHIVDGSLTGVPQIPDSIAKHGLGLYLAVIKFHNTDTATFKKSMKFYSKRPDLMNALYAGIDGRLTKKLDSLNKIKPKVNTDSINKTRLQRATDSIKRVKAHTKIDSTNTSRAVKKALFLQNLRNPKLRRRNALPHQ
jgi:hypothetical protein